MSMQQRLNYQVTFDEYIEASRAATAGNAGRFSPKGLIGWIIFVFLSAFLFVLINSSGSRRSSPSAALIPWLLIFGFIWFFVLRPWRSRFQKGYDSQPTLHRPKSLEISDDGITFTDK